MDLERYKALICAIETGSLSAAAEKLQYTPSGISRMITALEEEIGFSLLLREHNGVRPTTECQQLLPSIHNLLQCGNYCTQLAAQIKGIDIGTVTIGTAYNAFYSFLASIISKFHKQYPGIKIQFRSGYSTELLEQLNSHEIDLCFISKRDGSHNWIPICKDEMVAWLSVNHPLASRSSIPINTFEKEPYIETYPDKDIDNSRIFSKCCIKPNLQFSTMDSLATYSMVEAGLGISMNNAINGHTLSGKVRILPLTPSQIVEIGIATHSNLSPAANTFLNYITPYLKYFIPGFDK